jgi:hypothetical protein
MAGANAASRHEQRAASTPPAKSVHLLLLHHGLWGKAACVARLEAFLRQALCDDEAAAAEGAAPHRPVRLETVRVVNCTANEGSLTYDGDCVCGGGAQPRVHGSPAIRPRSRVVTTTLIDAAPSHRTHSCPLPGIDVCGSRVVQVVLDMMQELQAAGTPVARLSFVGYSLGGLVLR